MHMQFPESIPNTNINDGNGKRNMHKVLSKKNKLVIIAVKHTEDCKCVVQEVRLFCVV